MNVIDKLRTPQATLIVLCAALLSQMPHAADVFRMIVMGTGWPAVLHGYAYAVALELAVLLFVVQRRNVESYIFAGVSVLVNLSYYSLHGINLFTVAALPAWLVSIALPLSIAQYSHLLVQDDPKPTTQPQEESSYVGTPIHMDAVVETPQDAPSTPAPKQRKAVAKRKRKPAQSTPEQRQNFAMDTNADAAQIASHFGVSVRTAQADIKAIRNQTVQTNGVHA